MYKEKEHVEVEFTVSEPLFAIISVLAGVLSSDCSLE